MHFVCRLPFGINGLSREGSISGMRGQFVRNKQLEIKKFLFDIRESIESIENYLGDKRDFKVYMSNKMLRRAVEREFEIIGEAMNRIEKIDIL